MPDERYLGCEPGLEVAIAPFRPAALPPCRRVAARSHSGVTRYAAMACRYLSCCSWCAASWSDRVSSSSSARDAAVRSDSSTLGLRRTNERALAVTTDKLAEWYGLCAHPPLDSPSPSPQPLYSDPGVS